MLVTTTAFVLLITACSGGGSTRQPTSTTVRSSRRATTDGVLRLGQLAPITGLLAPIARSLTAPVELAVTEMNAAGWVHERPVQLAVVDDASDPTVGAAAFRRLRDAGAMDAMLGPASSNTALALLDPIRDARIPTCSGSTSASELSNTDSGGYYFRTAPPDSLQGSALANLVAKDGKRSPALLVRRDSYGAQFAEVLRATWRRLGVRPSGPLLTYDPDGTEFAAAAQAVADQHPDSIVLIARHDDGVKVLQSLIAKGLGPDRTAIYTADGMQSSTFGLALNPAFPAVARGIRGTSPAAAPTGAASGDALALRLAAVGVPNVFSSYYYDCAILLGLAAVKARSDDPAAMRAAFAQNLRGRVDCLTFAECARLIRSNQGVHYRGASSRFDRWQGTEPGQGVYDVWEYGSSGAVVYSPRPGDAQIAVP